MKTLLIKYLPSGDDSMTLKLLNSFLEQIPNGELEIRDLLKDPAPAFSLESLKAYKLRNYMGKTLNNEQAESLKKNDSLVRQFKQADLIVLAYPMHNFSMPGPIKTYFDSVMLNGETFGTNDDSMKHKKSLTLFTSGGDYSQQYTHMDTIRPLTKILFDFMKFEDHRVVSVATSNQQTTEANFQKAAEELKSLVKEWYKKEKKYEDSLSSI